MSLWQHIGPHRVAHSDAMAALEAIDHHSLDALIIDPPYCSGGSSEADKVVARSQGIKKDRDAWFVGDAMTSGAYAWTMREMAMRARAVLKPDAVMLVFCDWRMSSTLAPAIESAGLRYRNHLIWDKKSPALGKGFRAQHEHILLFVNGRTMPGFTARFGSVLTYPRLHHTKKQHPCEKPVGLLSDLIEGSTPPGGVVADVFCGSGSLGEAAVRLGRTVILSDWDPAFAAAAAERLRTITEQKQEIA